MVGGEPGEGNLKVMFVVYWLQNKEKNMLARNKATIMKTMDVFLGDCKKIAIFLGNIL